VKSTLVGHSSQRFWIDCFRSLKGRCADEKSAFILLSVASSFSAAVMFNGHGHAQPVSARFSRSEIPGFVAGFGTTFAAVPDLVAMLRRSSSKGMNPTMAAIMVPYQILSIWYGLLIVSRPVCSGI